MHLELVSFSLIRAHPNGGLESFVFPCKDKSVPI
jgi:hypothetical protein